MKILLCETILNMKKKGCGLNILLLLIFNIMCTKMKILLYLSKDNAE